MEKPTTVNELGDWMTNKCYNDGYAIGNRIIHEGYGLANTNGKWIWYYTERGHIEALQYFNTENEAAEFAYTAIKNDKTSNRHMIGFVKDKNDEEALALELTKRNIEFFKDQIPYGGINDKRTRFFVFGCDIKNVSDLAKIYFDH